MNMQMLGTTGLMGGMGMAAGYGGGMYMSPIMMMMQSLMRMMMRMLGGASMQGQHGQPSPFSGGPGGMLMGMFQQPQGMMQGFMAGAFFMTMPQMSSGGTLSTEKNGGPISYKTSGGFQVRINGDEVLVTDPTGKQSIRTWGDPHENLMIDGKDQGRINEWDAKSRTLILGDGTKITMSAKAANGVVDSTSIYDGNREIQVRNSGNQVVSDSVDPFKAMMHEVGQADGTAAYFGMSWLGKMVYQNMYKQDDKLNVTNDFKDLFAATGNKAALGAWLASGGAVAGAFA